MRYSHKIHQANQQKSPGIQRRQRITSFILIGAVIIFLLVFAETKTIDWWEFYRFFLSSLFSVAVAYIIAAFLALLLALGATKNKWLENILLPVLDVAQSFPTFALIPVLLAIFGTSRWVVIVFLVVTIIWPIVFTLITALKGEREDLGQAATIYNAHGLKRLWYFRLPSVFPAFISGSIIGWGEAWEALIGAEIIAKVLGVGSYLGKLGETGSVWQLVLGIAMYLFLIFILNQIIWLPLLNFSSRYQNES